jgi:hypothetical protein
MGIVEVVECMSVNGELSYHLHSSRVLRKVDLFHDMNFAHLELDCVQPYSVLRVQPYYRSILLCILDLLLPVQYSYYP